MKYVLLMILVMALEGCSLGVSVPLGDKPSASNADNNPQSIQQLRSQGLQIKDCKPSSYDCQNSDPDILLNVGHLHL